jgi:hypothetical protein
VGKYIAYICIEARQSVRDFVRGREKHGKKEQFGTKTKVGGARIRINRGYRGGRGGGGVYHCQTMSGREQGCQDSRIFWM